MNNILKSEQVARYLKSAKKNNWTGTSMEDYVYVGPKQKGGAGEIIVEAFMKNEGHTVEKPQDPGHDRIINGFKCEIIYILFYLGKGVRWQTKSLGYNNILHYIIGEWPPLSRHYNNIQLYILHKQILHLYQHK